jgi:hypothetical protein
MHYAVQKRQSPFEACYSQWRIMMWYYTRDLMSAIDKAKVTKSQGKRLENHSILYFISSKHMLKTRNTQLWITLWYSLYHKHVITVTLTVVCPTLNQKRNVTLHKVAYRHIHVNKTNSSAYSQLSGHPNVFISELPHVSVCQREVSTPRYSTGIALLLISLEKNSADFLAVLLRSGSLKSTWNRPNLALEEIKTDNTVRKI